MSNVSNPRRFLLQRRYADILQKPIRAEHLDLRVAGHPMGQQYKVIVRNKAKRHVYVLLLGELKKRGFDSHGKPVPFSHLLSTNPRPGFASSNINRCSLRGSVEVLLFKNVLSQQKHDVLQQVQSLVDEIVRRCLCQ